MRFCDFFVLSVINDSSSLTKKRMAGTIAAIRKNRTFSEQETDDENHLLEKLISRVPPKEMWEADFCLGMLGAG
jgi:hypothetical protein